MIQFLEHKEIDKQKWDACIQQSEHSTLFVYSWYLDVVCPHWSALVLNDYSAVFPLALKSKATILYVYQPFFTRYFGLYSKEKISAETMNSFIAAIPEKIKFIEYSVHESNYIQSKDYVVSEKKFQLLNLSLRYDQLKNNYTENAKRNIKKALRNNYIVEEGIAISKIVELFRLTKGNQLGVFNEKEYRTLTTLMATCEKHNAGQSFAVYTKDKKLCAAAFFMQCTDRFIFLKSGVTEEGKKNGAMHLMFDYFICQHANKKLLLDFGGSSIESVARFYKNFGAKEIVYLQIKKNNLPFPLKLFKK